MAKYQIGDTKISEKYLSDKLQPFIQGQKIARINSLLPCREKISPHSSFYELKVQLENGSEFPPIFIKVTSDEHRSIADMLPNSGKTIGAEIRALEFGNQYNMNTPQFYWAEDTFIENNGKNIKHALLFMRRYDESLEDILSRLDPNDEVAKKEASSHIKKIIDAILINGITASEQNYARDNLGRITVPINGRDQIRSEIKQALYGLLAFKFGRSSQTFDLDQVYEAIDHTVERNLTGVYKLLDSLFIDVLAEDEEGYVLYNLDMHPAQVMRDTKADKWVVVDNAKFGYGPLSRIPALLLYHPAVLEKFLPEEISKFADYTFEQYEKFVRGEKEIDPVRKKRFDDQMLAATRLSMLRVISFITNFNIKYPENAKALARFNVIWEPKKCLDLLIEKFVELDDGLTPYLKTVNDFLLSLNPIMAPR